MKLKPNHLADDLDHILTHTEGLWEELRGRRIFITGGTGFFGCWLLESLAWANDKLDLNVSAVVLSRNPQAFKLKAPHIYDYLAFSFIYGDIRTFSYPEGDFSHILHLATYDEEDGNIFPPEALDITLSGTKRVLEFARDRGIKSILFASTGAVYGKQPPTLSHIPEDHPGILDPFDTVSPYGTAGEMKRAAEAMCALFGKYYGLEIKVARCFTFIGPYMHLNKKYAISNFIREGLNGGPILVNGDGTPYRSYLYASDLAIWLWTILLKGESCRPYNVGSNEAITIADLARTVAQSFNNINDNRDLPAYSCFSNKAMIAQRQVPADYHPKFKSNPNYPRGKQAMVVLEYVAEHLNNYRSAKKSPKYMGDHDLMLNFLMGQTPEAAPKRAAFGLPHNYFFSSTKMSGNVDLMDGESKGRRGSPLFIHIQGFSDNSACGVFTFLPATLIPPANKILISGRGRPTVKVPPPDFSAVRDYMDDLINDGGERIL